MIRVRMNTAAVSDSFVLDPEREYNLPDDMAKAFVRAGRAELVESEKPSRKTKSQGEKS